MTTGWIMVGLVVLGAGAARVRSRSRRRSGVQRLEPYTGSTPADAPGSESAALGVLGLTPRVLEAVGPLATSVERTVGRRFARSVPGAAVSPAVERANLGVGVTELASVAAVVGCGVMVGMLAAGWRWFAAAGIAAAASAVPAVVVLVAGAHRRRRFTSELPDALGLLAGTLRAGVPLSQALGSVAADLGGPLADELRRVSTETALGRDLSEALEASGRRMGSDDLVWVAAAVAIHQMGGGNLAEVLDTVAHTVTERARLRREVASLTAEGRLSAIVLGLLPPLLTAVISVVNPGYLGALTSEPNGLVLVVGAVAAMVIGFVWMIRIVDVGV